MVTLNTGIFFIWPNVLRSVHIRTMRLSGYDSSLFFAHFLCVFLCKNSVEIKLIC